MYSSRSLRHQRKCLHEKEKSSLAHALTPKRSHDQLCAALRMNPVRDVEFAAKYGKKREISICTQSGREGRFS